MKNGGPQPVSLMEMLDANDIVILWNNCGKCIILVGKWTSWQ